MSSSAYSGHRWWAIGGIVALFLFGALPVFGECVYEASQTPSITIDGTVDSAWQAAPAAPVSQELQGAVGTSDCSATFRALWSDSGETLYFLVEVTDDAIVRDSGGNSWEDDGVEIYLDGDYSRTVGTSGNASGYDGVNDFQFRFLPSGGGEVMIGGAYYNSAVDYAFVLTGSGYVLEGAIDSSVAGIGPVSPGVTQIGWDVQVGDDDNGAGRDHKLGWCAMVDDTWYNPASFGTLRFAGEITGDPVSLTTSVMGQGAIQILPAKDTFVEGETVVLTAEPMIGYRFTGWTGEVTSSDNPLTLTLTGDLSLTAQFDSVPAGATVFAMNCGGSQYMAEDGDVYKENNYSNPRSSGRSDTRWITADHDYRLYLNWQTASTKLIYAIPLPNGLYEVDLKWAGLYGETASSGTLMDVSVAGELVEDDLNVVEAAGATSTALIRTYPAIVSGGELRIVLFRGLRGEPYLNAIEVRSVADPAGNAPPVLRIVDKPGVLGSDVQFAKGDFTSRFFDADGDALTAIRIAAMPVRGDLVLDDVVLREGDTVAAADLNRLVYRSMLPSQGRDHWQWWASDGVAWSEQAAAVHLFMRAGENRVENVITATWDTYSWPLNAYYPLDTNGNQRGNSCGPTARTHVNFFWKHPRQGEGRIQFSDRYGFAYDLDFAATEYLYDRMPTDVPYDAPESHYAAVARLMVDNDSIAVDVWGNGANSWEPMMPYQGFDGAAHVIRRDDVGEAAWIGALKHELNMGRLIQLEGINSTGGGHWWLVSGYNESDQFYAKLNFGGLEGFYDNGNFADYQFELRTMAQMQPATLGLMSLYAPVGGALQPELETGAAYSIRWSAPNSQTVTLEYSVDGGWNWRTIGSGIDAASGEYAWTLPSTEVADFRVRVTDESNLNIYDESEPIQLLGDVAGLTAQFETWIATFGSLTSAERMLAADPDGDGLANFAEFLLAGGDPVATNRAPCFEPAAQADTVVLEWPLRAGLDPASLVCEMIANPTSANWSDASAIAGVKVEFAGPLIRVTMPAALAPRFLRFRSAD